MTGSFDKPLVFRISIEPTKTLDDVLTIARTEGKKRFGRNVSITDMVKRSDTLFWVEVTPRGKYPSLDVEASKTVHGEL